MGFRVETNHEQVASIKRDWQKIKHLEEQRPRYEAVGGKWTGCENERRIQLSTWSHFSETPSLSAIGVACNLQSVGTELLCAKVPAAFLSDAHVFFVFFLSVSDICPSSLCVLISLLSEWSLDHPEGGDDLSTKFTLSSIGPCDPESCHSS